MADKNIDITAYVLRERAKLANFIRRRVRDETDAEDILQDVLREFIEAFSLTRPIEHAGAWLFRVARNRIIDKFRKRRELRLGDDKDTDEGSAPRLDLALPAADAGPEAEYARSELLKALQEALDELPDAQREVFVAHELEGKSFKAMAAQSGLSINTLLARKRYAVSFLRSRLHATYEDLDI